MHDFCGRTLDFQCDSAFNEACVSPATRLEEEEDSCSSSSFYLLKPTSWTAYPSTLVQEFPAKVSRCVPGGHTALRCSSEVVFLDPPSLLNTGPNSKLSSSNVKLTQWFQTTKPESGQMETSLVSSEAWDIKSHQAQLLLLLNTVPRCPSSSGRHEDKDSLSVEKHTATETYISRSWAPWRRSLLCHLTSFIWQVTEVITATENTEFRNLWLWM